MFYRILPILILWIVGLAGTGMSQLRVVDFGTGISEMDGWANINSVNFSGYGGFPGSSNWPAPIGSNVDGSGDAQLSRVAGSPTGGGPFLSSTSIYFGNYAQVANALGGTLRVSDSTPLANLKTIVFQIQIGEVLGYDFYNPTGAPALKVNGGSSVVNPLFSGVLDRYQSGVFTSPATGNDEPVFVNTWGYQWDVNSLGPISSFSIDFSAVTHSQVYALKLDQGTALFNVAMIPEPGVSWMLLSGLGWLLVRRRSCKLA
ncbi:PEP-CTERM sorting domain-containing protein [bacterium]|nr:PEP-CTERM sorting domain-containing protein [bacterium]